MSKQIKTILWLAIFSIAMGYMESAVVIYLRKIYYPGGFQFPLVPLDASLGLVELLREAATLIMLLGIATLSAKTTSLKFAVFIFCFAVWDLCYYLFLWLFLDWPESLLTWDILFLIPVPWVGPVLAPCIVSMTMLVLAAIIFYFQSSGYNVGLKAREWLLLCAGSMVIVFSFILDYMSYIRKEKIPGILENVSASFQLLDEFSDYIPVDFNWPLFLTGEIILLGTIAMLFLRMKRRNY